MLLVSKQSLAFLSIFFCIEWNQATEIIYPAAPLFRKRSGNSTADTGGCDCTSVEIGKY